jgi:hypothetical protein
MGSTLAQMNMEMCWMHEGQCQMHQPFQVNVGAILLSKEESLLLKII